MSIEELAGDTESALDFIENDSFNYSKLGIIGISQGGWIAPVVAAKRKDIDFCAVISGSLTNVEEQLKFEEVNNISQYTYPFIARLIANYTVPRLKNRKTISALIGFVPLPYWHKVRCSVLIAYGENDANCPVKKSLDILSNEQFENYIVKVYPKSGHGLINKEGTNVRKDFLNDLTNFIQP